MGEVVHDPIPITIVPGAHGPTISPAALTLTAGTPCLWRNDTSDEQVVEPFKGGPLQPGGTRLTLARRPGTYVFGLRSHPAARLTIVVM